MSVYIDNEIEKKTFIRTFNENCSQEDLIWHRDESNRELYIQQSNGWKLIVEGCLPATLVTDTYWFVPANKFHKLIKGEGDLIVRIKEL